MALPIHGFETRTVFPASQRAPTAPRFYLVIVREGSSSIFHLPSEGMVTVGRAPECDLAIDDASMSRRHARFVVSSAGISVEDLESRNGTVLNGVRLTAASPVIAGDVVTLGLVTLIVCLERTVLPERSLLESATIFERLHAEAERALRFRRPLHVLMVSLAPDQQRSRADRAILAILRRVDHAGWVDGARSLIVLPELSPAPAEALAVELRDALAAEKVQAAIGSASCPRDGCDADTLIAAARSAAERTAPGEIGEAASSATRLDVRGHSVIVAAPAMHRLYALVRRLAASELPILVTGETGAGKELIAQALHAWSPRVQQPFVALNCAAIQDTLVESELFGHERGAFSGAVTTKIGLLETARGGTVFLDEVGELSLAAQAKLLRALETGAITRVGDVKERSIDVRLVAATNRELEKEAEEGKFRRDLLFRLRAATVVLPPLRDRPQEIPLLAEAFLAEAREKMPAAPRAFSLPALQILMTRPWPGNIRELRNHVRYLAATTQAEVIEAWHLVEEGSEGLARADPPGPQAAEAPATEPPAPSFKPIAEELRELERRRMVEALEACGGQQNRAAKLLDMPLRTFTLKVKKYGLNRSGGQ